MGVGNQQSLGVNFFFRFKISILRSKYEILQHSKKSVHGGPRHVGVADQPTQVAKFFFCSKLVFRDPDMRFGGISGAKYAIW